MSNLIKRGLALALALILTLSCVPGNALTVRAAGTLDTGVAGLTAEWTDYVATGNGRNEPIVSWEGGNATITGTIGDGTTKRVKGGYTTLILKNTLPDEAILSFLWEGSTIARNGSVTVTYTQDGTEITETLFTATQGNLVSGGDTAKEITLTPGATVVFTVTAANTGNNATEQVYLNLKALNLYVDVQVTTTFKAVDSAQGSYTVNGTAITADTLLAQGAAVAYEVEAVPAEGYVFGGWYSETEQTTLSTDAVASIKLDSNQTVYPLFIPETQAVWGVGGASFTNLEDAFYCASLIDNKVVTLLRDYTLTESVTIPEGITVLIPFDEERTCYLDKPAALPRIDADNDGNLDNTLRPWIAPYAFRTLTLASGVEITVEGNLSVSAMHHGGGQRTAGAPYGPCGFVETVSGSKITVADGGNLYAWGYIIGSGTVEALSGSAVYETIQFTDFRGGNASSQFLPKESQTPEEQAKRVVFPFNQYYVQNVEVAMTIHSGAKECIYTSIFAADDNNSIGMDFIGSETSMFRLGTGTTLTKRYDGATDRLVIDVDGDISVNGMSIDMSQMGQSGIMDSSMFNLPITNNITINIHGGTTEINQNVALQAGAEINVDEGATLYVNKDWNVYVYDRDEWMSGKFVHNNANLVPVSWSSVNGTTAVRNNDSLVDAKINVNGTLEVSGYIYSTLGGANICSSEGTGQVILWYGNGNATETWQTTQENTDVTFVSIPLVPVQLKNGDGTYTSTADANPDYGAAYFYDDETGLWYAAAVLSFDGNGAQSGSVESVEIENIDIYDGWNDVELPENGFTRENGVFLGWDEDPNAVNPTYLPGDTFYVYENTTLYAIWEVTVPTYTVTWVDENGDVVYTETVEEGKDAQNVPEVPAKEGHTGEWKEEATNVTEDITIEPVYTVNSYKLTFKSGRTSEVIATFAVPYGTALASYIPEVPELEGMTFAHWYVLTEGYNNAAEIPATMPAQDLEYYAYYELETYTLTFDLNGGTTEDEVTYSIGYNKRVGHYGPAVTKEGHTFLYWADEDGNKIEDVVMFTMPAHDVTLKAVWETNSYTVTINGNTGRDDAQYSVGVKYGDEYKLPANTFSRIGYTFGGWYVSGNSNVIYQPGETYPITGDVTFVAKWNVNQYNLIFIVNGETVKTVQVDYQTSIDSSFLSKNAPAVNVEGHSLVGWRSDKWAYNSFSMPAEDVKLTASLEKNNYKLTWIIDGVETSSYVEYGAAITAPAAPTKEGHTFIGWEGDTIPATMPAKALTITLTSKWSVNSYKLTWIVDGVTTTETVAYGTEIKAPAAPTKEGYSFTGWEGEIPATMPAEDITITLTSTWDINSYTLTWIIDGVTTAETVVYGGEIKEPADPTKEGHTFTGWEGDTIPATMPAKDLTITLTSKWSVNRYTITFDNNGADNPVYPTYADEYGEVLDLPEPGKTGYKFLGWFDADGKNWVGEKMPAYDLELTAKWEILTYTVTWVDEAGNTVDTETVEYGKDATKNPAVPEKEGYTGEWNYIATDVVCDVTIRPVYTINFYTLTIQSFAPVVEFGAPGHVLIEVQVRYGEKLANHIHADVLGIGETVTVDGTQYSGTYTIIGWASWDEENGYVAIDLDTATMPAGNYTIVNDFSFTGWCYEDEGTTYVVDYKTVYTDTVAHIDGEAYLFDEDGYIVAGAGLVRHVTEDGTVEYYYFEEDSYTAFKDGTLWIDDPAEQLPEWVYTFDERGVINHHEDTSLNGLVDQGEDTIYYIDGVPAYMGLIEVDGDLYYVRSSGKLVKDTTYWITKTNGLLEENAYAFDAEGKLIRDQEEVKNGIVEENGGLYYYENGELTYAGLIEIDGEFYYVRSNGQLAQNQKYWITKTNGLKPEQSYYFNEKGQIYTPVEIREDGYYYENGVKTYAGLIMIDGDYYYVNSSCQIVKNCTYWITKTNDLLPEKAYTFDADGKIVFDETELKTGIFDGYYYENGVKTYAGLIMIGEDYYYVNSSCQVVKNCSYWISKTNDLLPEGRYTFDETGKMVR